MTMHKFLTHFRTFAVGVVATLLLVALNKCGGEYETITKVVVVNHTDTIVETKIKVIEKEGPERIVYLNTPTKIEDNEDSSSTYTYDISEEDLTGRFTTQIKGEIVKQELEYQIKYPEITNTETITITNTDSVYVYTTKYEKEKKMLLYLGAEAGTSFDTPDFGIDMGVNIGLKLKNDYMVYYEYNMHPGYTSPNTHKIGLNIPIKIDRSRISIF